LIPPPAGCIKRPEVMTRLIAMTIPWDEEAELVGGGNLSGLVRKMTLREAVKEAWGWPLRQRATTTIRPPRPIAVDDGGPELAVLDETAIGKLAARL